MRNFVSGAEKFPEITQITWEQEKSAKAIQQEHQPLFNRKFTFLRFSVHRNASLSTHLLPLKTRWNHLVRRNSHPLRFKLLKFLLAARSQLKVREPRVRLSEATAGWFSDNRRKSVEFLSVSLVRLAKTRRTRTTEAIGRGLRSIGHPAWRPESATRRLATSGWFNCRVSGVQVSANVRSVTANASSTRPQRCTRGQHCRRYRCWSQEVRREPAVIATISPGPGAEDPR